MELTKLTQDDIKTLTKGLKRELNAAINLVANKAFSDSAGKFELSYNQTLEIVAKALSTKGASELLAKVPAKEKVQAPVEASLVNNKGEFDLLAPGEDGKLVRGLNFEEISGTVEDLFACVSYVSEYTRVNGKLRFDHDGETEINWNNQKTRRDDKDYRYFATESDGEIVSEQHCILVPQTFDPDSADLPVRDALVYAYLKEIEASHADDISQMCEAVCAGDYEHQILTTIATKLKFSLHIAEKAKLGTLLMLKLS